MQPLSPSSLISSFPFFSLFILLSYSFSHCGSSRMEMKVVDFDNQLCLPLHFTFWTFFVLHSSDFPHKLLCLWISRLTSTFPLFFPISLNEKRKIWIWFWTHKSLLPQQTWCGRLPDHMLCIHQIPAGISDSLCLTVVSMLTVWHRSKILSSTHTQSFSMYEIIAVKISTVRAFW